MSQFWRTFYRWRVLYSLSWCLITNVIKHLKRKYSTMLSYFRPISFMFSSCITRAHWFAHNNVLKSRSLGNLRAIVRKTKSNARKIQFTVDGFWFICFTIRLVQDTRHCFRHTLPYSFLDVQVFWMKNSSLNHTFLAYLNYYTHFIITWCDYIKYLCVNIDFFASLSFDQLHCDVNQRNKLCVTRCGFWRV